MSDIESLFKKFMSSKSKKSQSEFEDSIRHKKKATMKTSDRYDKLPDDVDLYQDVILEPSIIEPDNEVLMEILDKYGVLDQYKKMSVEGKMNSAETLLKTLMMKEEERDKGLDKTQKWYHPGMEPDDMEMNQIKDKKIPSRIEKKDKQAPTSLIKEKDVVITKSDPDQVRDTAIDLAIKKMSGDEEIEEDEEEV